MEKRSRTQGNKPKSPAFVGDAAPVPSKAQLLAALEQRAVEAPAEPSASQPGTEIDQIIAAIQGDIRAARAKGDSDLCEKLRGRLIQAERMRSKSLDDMRKHELRLIDSTEWQVLSAKLARMVAGCDRCRDAVLTLIDGDDDA